jgi:hypothetical protein
MDLPEAKENLRQLELEIKLPVYPISANICNYI